MPRGSWKMCIRDSTYSDIERIYKDGGAISKEYVPAVTTLAQKGIMEGIYGRFEPQSTLTRAQFMKLLCAVLKPEPGRTVMTFRDVKMCIRDRL